METRKPSFFWQGVLILTPVLILTGIGVAALWKERQFAMRDAEGRAQQLASWVASRILNELDHLAATTPSDACIQFDETGKLIFPRDFERVPAPQPLNLDELTPEQRGRWESAQRTGLNQEGVSDWALRWEQFLKTKPPARFAALARFRRGLLLEQTGHAPEAVRDFAEITNRFAGACSESGLPLDLLARAYIQPRAAFLRYAIDHPCAVTERLITEASGKGAPATAAEEASALELWRQQEQFRDLAQLARVRFKASTESHSATNGAGPEVMPPPFFWITNHEVRAHGRWRTDWSIEYFMIKGPGTNGFSLTPRIPVAISELVEKVLSDAAVPAWLDFEVSLAGRNARSQSAYNSLVPKLELHPRGGPAESAPLFCTVRTGEAESALVLKGRLAKKDLLLAQQQRRTLWFGFVIAAAGCASVAGFVSGYRAFHKQHRLAELKSNFVSSVSHELRAPVASIRLMAESLERGKVADAGKQHEYFRFIVQECRRLSSMIQNVLDFARIDQGRRQYQFEPTDIVEMATQTAKLMEPYAAERGVVLQLRPVAGELTATVDGPALQQALINLIDNAIKHSAQGASVNISISHCNDRLAIAVEDHGPGIPAEEHEKIFERFYRLGSELRRETPGVGIGLSIVKHILDAHHGTVRVESEPGKGSRFILELPLSPK